MSESSNSRQPRVRANHLLFGGVLTSAAASVCCLGPFFLLATGISGAWMSRLMVLESYFPILAAISLAFITAAGWQLTRPRACTSEAGQQEALSLPATGPLLAFTLALVATLALLSSEYWIVWVAG